MLTVVVAFSIMIGEIYHEGRSNMQREIAQEAEYLSDCINHFGGSYIEQLGNLQNTTRATLISPDGQVLYDSVEDEITLEEHSKRPEIIEALANGTGTDLRKSDSYKEQRFYYAKRLDDGNILRLSKELDSIFSIALSLAPLVILMTIVITIIAIMSSRWEADRLVRPINELDLNDPLKNDVYEELQPLLLRIDRQNKETAANENLRITMSGSHETVMGFKQPLDEMVYNICENAIKYNTENGKIDVWVGRVDDVVTLRVKDTGIGIPESEQERAFERFYRVDKSHSSAMLHGAVIDMESKVGVGTVMTVSFVNGEAAG